MRIECIGVNGHVIVRAPGQGDDVTLIWRIVSTLALMR
jgi:hypothetical protein